MVSDLEAVPAAYKAVRDTGALDLPSRRAAEAAYRARHPDAGEGTSYRVAQLIYDASRKGLVWPVRS